MAIPVRALARAFIKPDHHTHIDKKSYVEHYAQQMLVLMPYRPYSSDTALDVHIDIWSNPSHSVERLLKDSELTTTIPLVSTHKTDTVKLEALPEEIIKNVHEYYPLFEGETISTVHVLCLEHDWEGLAKGTLFFERKTNFSQTYLALPDFRWNLETGTLLPSALCKMEPISTFMEPVSIPSDNLLATEMMAALDDIPPELDYQQLNSILSITLDTLSTLSWATPAGPFVSAGISILKVILDSVLSGDQPSLLDNIQMIGKNIVDNITQFLENAELQEALNAVKVFLEWLSNMSRLIDTQSHATSAFHLTRSGGILETLNDQLGPGVENNLFYLVKVLSDDADLNLTPDGKVKPYDSPHRWAIANAKLHLLFFVISQYLTALKLKIVLVATLYEYGYNEHGQPIDVKTPDPDNTFSLLSKELEKYKNLTPEIIANVRKRREASIVLETGPCFVAYSRAEKPVAKRDEWKSVMNSHDALYCGYIDDLLVRAREDNPSTSEFRCLDNGDTVVSPGGGRGSWRPTNPAPLTVGYNKWERTEVRDKAVYDGKNPQDFVLHNGWATSYEPNTARAEALKAKYVASVLQEFDKWTKIPEILNESATSLATKWTPQIPQKLPGILGGLRIAHWGDKAPENVLWYKKTIDARYRFSLRNTIGKESDKSDDITSTTWTDVERAQRRDPTIIGFPKQGEYLTYVKAILLYRQFREANQDGSFRYGDERPIAIINRQGENNEFQGEFVDEIETETDAKKLGPRN